MRKSRKGMKRNSNNFNWKAVSEYRPSAHDVQYDIEQLADYNDAMYKYTDVSDFKHRYLYSTNAFCYRALFEVCAIELFIQNTILSEGELFDADALYRCEQRQLHLIDGVFNLKGGTGWIDNEDIATYVSDLYQKIKN